MPSPSEQPVQAPSQLRRSATVNKNPYRKVATQKSKKQEPEGNNDIMTPSLPLSMTVGESTSTEPTIRPRSIRVLRRPATLKKPRYESTTPTRKPSQTLAKTKEPVEQPSPSAPILDLGSKG
ncbi:hypothetical protein BGX31_006286 [Mortierella sp. GBA43]|nr:hypothetical protein BGX31_006286 [Mortierella sp. GBA43]